MKTGATKNLFDMEVGGSLLIAAEQRASYQQLASRLKKNGKGKWRIEAQPDGAYAIWREA